MSIADYDLCRVKLKPFLLILDKLDFRFDLKIEGAFEMESSSEIYWNWMEGTDDFLMFSLEFVDFTFLEPSFFYSLFYAAKIYAFASSI